LQPEISNKLREWLDSGLQDWDISRNAPYFGFQIPGTSDKYFYVWLDAPIAYIASHKHTTSLARTSPTFIAFSGPPCCKAQVFENPAAFSAMAF